MCEQLVMVQHGGASSHQVNAETVIVVMIRYNRSICLLYIYLMCDTCQMCMLQRRWIEIEVECLEAGSSISVCNVRPLNGFGSDDMMS